MATIGGPLRPEYNEPQEGAVKQPKKSRFTGEMAQSTVHKKRSREKSSSEETEHTYTSAKSKEVEKTLKKLAHLGKRRALSGEDLPLIVKLESQLREIVELPHFAGKERYQRLYDEKALPLLQKAKIFIRNHPMHFSVQAAAEKGKAAVVGLETLSQISNIRKIKPNVDSAQKVYIFRESGAVLKKMDAIAREESRQVDNLLTIMAKGSVLGTFDFKAKRVEAKPFVNMVLVGDLEKMPIAKDRLFDRLTADAEFIAALIGEVQLLDLHSNNLALTPEITEDLSRFSDFTLDGEEVSLNQLLLAYLNDDIDDMSAIGYREDGILYESQLTSLPNDLRNALDSKWKFVLFDTDTALGESNSLQYQVIKNEKSHLIPLRSCLLETSFKDSPLSAETVSRLLNSKERDQNVRSWATRADAPIFQHLKPEAQKRIGHFIEQKLEKYSLTNIRMQSGKQSMKQIQARFVHDITKPTEENRAFWQYVQANSTLKGDLSDIATQKRIAAQFFPRLTLKQQEALFERQASRDHYLQSYHDFASGKPSIRAIEKFIHANPSLFSITRREALLSELGRIKSFDTETTTGWLQSYWKGSKEEQIEAFRAHLLEETRPTLFLLMKAMYPLLADVYELAAYAYGEENAGGSIGFFDQPIETIIRIVREHADEESEIGKLATHVEEEIQKVKNPSLLGIF